LVVVLVAGFGVDTFGGGGGGFTATTGGVGGAGAGVAVVAAGAGVADGVIVGATGAGASGSWPPACAGPQATANARRAVPITPVSTLLLGMGAS
jgi:hypothetical protein